MNPAEHRPRLEDSFFTRGEFLRRSGMGFGALSLASLLGPGVLAHGARPAAFPRSCRKTRRSPPRPSTSSTFSAEGAPSHVDTWDPKPALQRVRRPGTPRPSRHGFPSPFKFNKQGKSGIEVSEVFPKLGEHVDDMAVIRSMYTDIPAHEVAQVFMNTGSLRLPRPSLGSWVTYGLGTENQNMPGFIVLRPGGQTSMTAAASLLPARALSGDHGQYREARSGEIIENIRNQFMSHRGSAPAARFRAPAE